MSNIPVQLFKFGPVVQEELEFKDISILSFGCHFVQQRGTSCALLVEGINLMGTCVKVFKIWTSGSGGAF